MSKIELNTSIADYGFSQINANFQLIEDELNQKVLYRDNPVGEPNSLENIIDSNGNDIINVNDLRVDNEIFLRGLSIDEAIDEAAGGLVGDAEDAAASAQASAILAQSSANASAASAAASEASFDSFDDRYLGAKNTPPTLDNDGNALQLGALYWDNVLPPGGTFPATAITFEPAGDISATLVQSAIVELDTEKAKLNGDAAVAFSSSAFTGGSGSFTTVVATGTITPSQTNGIVGTTTNNNANAGSVGEFTSASNTGTSMVTNTSTNVTSVSLTAGDWDVSAYILGSPAGGANITTTEAGITSTSATMPTGIGSRIFNQLATTGAFIWPLGTVRFSLSATTTVYLVGRFTFAAGTATADGFIRARRVR